MKKILYIIVIIAAIGLSGGYYAYRNNGPDPVVSTAEVSVGDIVETVGATGTLEAVTTVQVGTQVSGTVLELNADFNSIVRKGQVIARLDPSLLQTTIEQNRANVIRAEADLERLKVQVEDSKNKLRRAQELSAKNLIPKTELETADVAVKNADAQVRSSLAQVTQARATLNQSQVNMQHTVISAPIDGIVISRNVDVGQTVAASLNAPVLYLLAADLTKMKVSASIDESDVGKIRPGQVVRFRVDAYPAEDFIGRVWQVRLNPVVVQNVVTYATIIEVPNPQLKLKPGMTANVTIEIARKDKVVRVPNTTLRFRATADMFTALNLAVPAELQRGAGAGRQGGPGGAPGTGRAGAAGAAGTTTGGAASSGETKAAPSETKAQPEAKAPDTKAQTDAKAARTAPSSGGPESTGRAAGAAKDSGSTRGAESGGGRGQGGRQLDPEARRKMMEERMANMSPEEKERFQQRMRDRAQAGEGGGQWNAGGRGGGAGGSRAGGADATTLRPFESLRVAPSGVEGRQSSGQGSGRGRGAGSGAAPAEPRSAVASSGAQTIDALFAPLPPTVNPGRVWLWVSNELKSIRIRTGITDGQFSEVISGDLQPGMQLVTGITTGREPQPAGRGGQQGGQNPMIPGGNRGGFGGGPGGGGGGRGR